MSEIKERKITYFITGSSRGIGLQLVKQILISNNLNQVIATARNPESSIGLQLLLEEFKGRIITLILDVTDLNSVQHAADVTSKLEFAKNGIDVLINNAGTFAGEFDSPIESAKDLSDLKLAMSTNLYGPVSVTQALLPLLRMGKKKQICNISALGGSFGGPMGNVSAASSFCVSKAALNMWTRKLSLDLHSEGFTVNPFHPGFVNTTVGGSITPEESAICLIKVFNQVNHKKDTNGKFLQYDGFVLPW